MAHPARADTATKFARTVLREGFNDRLCDITVEQGHAEAAFFCECGDVDCQTCVTVPVATFNELRAAWRPVLAEGHSPY
jgi:hypothetical protein